MHPGRRANDNRRSNGSHLFMSAISSGRCLSSLKLRSSRRRPGMARTCLGMAASPMCAR